MRRCQGWLLLPVFLTVAAGQPWKDKQAAEWTDDEARQILADSPWAMQATPKVNRPQSGGRGGGMGRGGRGGIGIGGGGMGGRGGMGGGRGGMGTPPTMPGGQTGGQRDDRSERRPQTPRNLTVRWESAAPVQTAHLKLHESDVPTVDESHYAIVVAGIPNRMAQSDAKPKAELKRKGQKTIKSSEAKMIPRDNGNLVIFFFPRSREITLKDQQVDFEGRIGVMEVNQSFDVTAMQLDGKLQL